MNGHPDREVAHRLSGLIYRKLLGEVGEVAARTRQRLCALRSRFPDLAGLLDGPAAALAPNRRRARRVVCSDRAAVLTSPGPGGEVPAVVADRSPGGMSLWLDSPVPVGADLIVRVEEPAQHIRAEVRHCWPRPCGGWAAGVQVLGNQEGTQIDGSPDVSR